MKLSNPEKLILLMLSDIYEKVGLDEINTKLIRSAIYSENTWALDWELPGVVGSDAEEAPSEVTRVLNYLDMWNVIEEAYSTFDKAAKHQIAVEAAPFGSSVRFPGFDGNNEGRYLSIANMLVDDMGRFSRYRGLDLNSHVPLVAKYEKMYKVFEPMRKDMSGLSVLTPVQVAQLMAVRKT